MAMGIDPPMFCESCHRVERDPIMLDTETCSRCGSPFLTWHDLDPDRYREDRDERKRIESDPFHLDNRGFDGPTGAE